MMAASKPTSWLSSQLHFLKSTESGLGTLADGLDCFPLDNEAYPPLSDSRDKTVRYSEFDWFRYPGKDPRQISALPPPVSDTRLALKLFRREPAITEFDWSFAPIRSSSKSFSTLTSSDLHSVLPEVHPGHG